MGNLIGNSLLYNMHATNEVAEILSHFDPTAIQIVIADQLDRRFQFNPIIAPVNLVESLEQNFKQILDYLPEEQQRIYETRTSVYAEIIEQIAGTYNLEMNPTYESTSGNYIEARILYDFFIGQYMQKAIEFFTNIVSTNAGPIYQYLKMDEHKEATAYAKKIYANNVKLGVLVNNMDAVVDTMCGFDYDIDSIFRTVYTTLDYNLITNLIRDRGDFYKRSYVSLFANPDLRATLITEIRLAIHSKYMAENNISQMPINITTEDISNV